MEIVYYRLDFLKVRLWEHRINAGLVYIIPKEKWELDKAEIYVKRIQHLEKDLGIEITDFSDWGIE